MKCRDAELTIIQNADALPEDVLTHVQACPSCRAFASVHKRLLHAQGDDLIPPREVDDAVLNAAHDLLPGIAGKRPRWLLRLHSTPWIAAAASLILVTVLSAVLLNRLRPENGPGAMVAASAKSPELAGDMSRWTQTAFNLAIMEAAIDLALD